MKNIAFTTRLRRTDLYFLYKKYNTLVTDYMQYNIIFHRITICIQSVIKRYLYFYMIDHINIVVIIYKHFREMHLSVFLLFFFQKKSRLTKPYTYSSLKYSCLVRPRQIQSSNNNKELMIETKEND